MSAIAIKRDRFAKGYAIHGNATRAAKEAGYSPRSAHDTGYDLLKVPEVRHKIISWQERLEAAILPSLDTIEKLRDQEEDKRLSLAASRDLLNRAGVGKAIEKQTNVVNVIATMDETKLLAKMAELARLNSANPSANMLDVSHNSYYATQQNDKKVDVEVPVDQRDQAA